VEKPVWDRLQSPPSTGCAITRRYNRTLWMEGRKRAAYPPCASAQGKLPRLSKPCGGRRPQGLSAANIVRRKESWQQEWKSGSKQSVRGREDVRLLVGRWDLLPHPAGGTREQPPLHSRAPSWSTKAGHAAPPPQQPAGPQEGVGHVAHGWLASGVSEADDPVPWAYTVHAAQTAKAATSTNNPRLLLSDLRSAVVLIGPARFSPLPLLLRHIQRAGQRAPAGTLSNGLWEVKRKQRKGPGGARQAYRCQVVLPQVASQLTIASA
jgi:hypothetical protein